MDIFYREGLFPWSKNKAYNFQLYFDFCVDYEPFIKSRFELLYGTSWFHIGFTFLAGLIHLNTELSRKRDHAGFVLELGLFGVEILIQTYDKRHWDDENNCWLKYEDEL